MHNDRHMSFFVDPTNEAEIINIINHLKEGAPGRDEIVARNLKCISDSIAYPLAQVANLSFQQGIFPEELKIAAVTPLYKAKDPMMFNNYRPISLLSVFAKILERLMYNRLLKFINKNQIFNKHQFGFRDKHSTFMALIILIENLVNAIDNGKCAVGIFLNFQKAFDTVDHCILLDKLYFYGIRGQAFDWFSSYLHNRQQLVNYYGYESDLKYNELFKLHQMGFVTWVTRVGELVDTYSINIDDSPAKFKSECKRSVFGKFTHAWSEDVQNIQRNPILRTYCKIKQEFGMETYLELIKNHKYRTAMAQLRTSSHALAIEYGRYTRPKTKLEDRCCLFCTHALEDEKHFLVECIVNKTERDILFSKVERLFQNFSSLDGDEKFIFLLNSDDQQVLTWVGKFIYDSFKTRNEKLV